MYGTECTYRSVIEAVVEVNGFVLEHAACSDEVCLLFFPTTTMAANLSCNCLSNFQRARRCVRYKFNADIATREVGGIIIDL